MAKDPKPKLRLIRGGADKASEKTTALPSTGQGDAALLSRKPIYQLRVVLQDIEPEIWRRVRVSGNISLGTVHDVIQACMGWENYHLHEFQLEDGRRFTCQDYEPDPGAGDERKIKLRTAAPGVGAELVYLYDFGDDWYHRVVVEEILPPGQSGPVPRCLAGARACPPEDVGGPLGYERYLEIMADPRHPDHEDMQNWRGELGADVFSPAEANVRLS